MDLPGRQRRLIRGCVDLLVRAVIVVEGVMFLSGWDGWVWASRGRRCGRSGGTNTLSFGRVTVLRERERGVAVAQGKVFSSPRTPHVLALEPPAEARVGQDLRRCAAGESATGAPLVVKNMVIVGSSGASSAYRHLARSKLETGGTNGAATRSRAGRARLRHLLRRCQAWARGGANCCSPGPSTRNEPAVRGHRQPGAPTSTAEVREATTSTPTASSGGCRRRPDSLALPVHPARLVDYDSIGECILSSRTGANCSATSTKNGYFFVLDRPHERRIGPDHPLRGPNHLGAITRERQGDAKVYPEKEENRSTSTQGRPAPRNGPTRPTARRPSSSRPGPGRRGNGHPAPPGVQGEHPYWGAGVQCGHRGHGGSVSAFDAKGSGEVALRNELPMCASVLATGGGSGVRR